MKRKLMGLILGIGLIGGWPMLGLCSTIWPMYRGNPERTGWNVLETGVRPPLTLAWRALHGDPDLADVNLIIEASPVIMNGKVYVATIFDGFGGAPQYNSSLICLDMKTGQIIWHTQLGEEGIWVTPTLDPIDQVIYAAAWDGNIYALDAQNGSILWQQNVAQPGSRALRASPVIHQGRLYVGTYQYNWPDVNGVFYTLDALTGSIMSARLLEGGMFSSPVMVEQDRLVIAATRADGNSILQMYDMASGQISLPLWQKNLSGESFSTPVYKDGKIFHRILEQGDLTQETKLYVLDAQTGNPLIPSYTLPGFSYGSFSSPAIDENYLYIATSNPSAVTSFNVNKLVTQDPNPIDWSFFVPDGGFIFSSPAVANGFVYFGTDDTGNPEGVFYALDKVTGQEAWRYQFQDGVGSAQASVAVAEGSVVFVSYDDNNGVDHGVFAFHNPEEGSSFPPVLNAVGDKFVQEGQELIFNITANDPNPGDVLLYSVSPLPSGASFDSVTRVFNWTPGYDQAGSYPVTFTVTDSGQLSDAATITITVTDVNQAPVLAAIGSKTIGVGATLFFSLSANDPDYDSLNFSVMPIPANASLTPTGVTTASFGWTPSVNQLGAHSLTFTVSDDRGGSDSESITVTVGANSCSFVNRARCASASASSSWSAAYSPAKANDGKMSTRWNSASGNVAGAWLALDFGVSSTFNKIVLKEALPPYRIKSYSLQYWNGAIWQTVATGATIGSSRTHIFPTPVTTQKVRLWVSSATATPTIFEMEVY